MAAPVTGLTGHLVDGVRIDGVDERIEVINPATEEVIAAVPAGTVDQVNAAVVAARSAFEGWAATPVAQRVAAVRRIADGIQARADEFAATMTAEMGPRSPSPARCRCPTRSTSPAESRTWRITATSTTRSSATRSSCASRSAWSARSRRGTSRCNRSSRR